MERLWTAWQADPEARTLVFCCSRRHALDTRDWLCRRKVRAAAVFSGSGGDPRSDSLNAFIDGKLQALCVVDLFKSPKRVTEEDWSHDRIELLPLNRDYAPIIVTPHEAPEMVVVGEWVTEWTVSSSKRVSKPAEAEICIR